MLKTRLLYLTYKELIHGATWKANTFLASYTLPNKKLSQSSASDLKYRYFQKRDRHAVPTL